MFRQLLRLVPALVLAGLAFVVLTGPRQASAKNDRVHVYPADSRVVKQIRHYQGVTWHWQGVMGVRHTPSSRATLSDPSIRFKLWVRDTWRRRAHRVLRQAVRPPHKSAWLCIHHYEGAWTDPSPPYYGGLQMDLGFQRTYGRELLRRKGTANHWTPLEQMWVAERAHRSGRGYYPWPNTARYCGLI